VSTTTLETAGGVKVVKPTVASHFRDYIGRIRGGDLGAMPAVLGLVILALIFGSARSETFFSAGNFANLFNQAAGIIMIAMGLIFVLLLGEIDLSAGFAAGVIGLLLGFLVAKVGIPSFVVTLAAFLAFQGVLLNILGEGKNISIPDGFIKSLNKDSLSVTWSWILAIAAVGVFALVQFLRYRGRAKRNLVNEPIGILLLRIGGIGALVLITTAILTQERAINPAIASLKGVPIAAPVIGGFLVLWTFVLSRTSYGRHVYAVGGNAEASRRAGIPVDRIRISVFVIGSFMAAVGGVMLVSRAGSVDPNTGGSSTLLYAVGAAVIGGTSLFGGKGKIIHAVIGGAVIAVIDNGMFLMDFSSGTRYMFTGVILLIAAGVDALARRRAAATGNR
jgi:D-xylose transport system permease protein